MTSIIIKPAKPEKTVINIFDALKVELKLKQVQVLHLYVKVFIASEEFYIIKQFS